MPEQPTTATLRSRVRVPLRFGDGYRVDAELVTFHGLADGQEHVAVVLGPVGEPGAVPLVRLHSECLTGDVFGSARCDCGPQLREAVERIAERGGVLLYLRQEGRGIGLYNKLDAYALQDQGLDTYAANTALGLPEDARDYTAAAQMLRALDVERLDLLSNNPDKAGQLRDLGIDVRDRVPTGVFTTAHNVRYLRAKVLQTQHTLPLAELADMADIAKPRAV
ncbi:GTP cyclohydrolase-2 [Actinobacteria bacterium OK074]|nr:GTP cyclohydrolase-2 [Actinobacteria bacterium OK074]